MIDFLIDHFMKNTVHADDGSKREAYGILTGLVGAFCNTALFIFKLILGQTARSVAIMADAFNNLSRQSVNVDITIHADPVHTNLQEAVS
jgi:hypothetical protein